MSVNAATNSVDKNKYVPVAEDRVLLLRAHFRNSVRKRSVLALSCTARFVWSGPACLIARLTVLLTAFLNVVHEEGFAAAGVFTLLPPLAREVVVVRLSAAGAISMRTVYSILAMVSRARVRWRLGLLHSCKWCEAVDTPEMMPSTA